MRDNYLFVVRKSIFANNHKIFFFFLTALECILAATGAFDAIDKVLEPLLGGKIESTFVYDLLDSVMPQAVWDFLANPLLMWCFAVLSLIIGIFIVIDLKTYAVIFYKDRIVIRYGLIDRKEKQMPLTPILDVHMEQGFWGRIFDYANFTVTKVGTDNLKDKAEIGDMNGFEGMFFRVADAGAVKECLEEMIIRTQDDITAVVGNHEARSEKPLSVRLGDATAMRS